MKNYFLYIKRFECVSFLGCLFFFGILITGCNNLSEPTEKLSIERLPALNIAWDSTNSIVCFGTSLTYGLIWDKLEPVSPVYSLKTFETSAKITDAFFYHQADSAYPHCLDKILEIKVYNRGFVGATTERALELVQDSVLSYNPALVILEFSANDFLRGTEVSIAKANMDTLITIIQNFGSEIVLISFVDQYTLENPPKDHFLYDQINLAKEYFSMLQDLSIQYDILFIKDCFQGIFGNKEYMCDDIHPNEKGYAKMANNIFYSLYHTFTQNNMYKIN